MSAFGTLYTVTTFGESHCKAVGCIVENFPPGITIDLEYIQKQLDRRRPGQSHITTPRKELDKLIVLSGLEHGNVSLGTPICMMVNNLDQRPQDYSSNEMSLYPRPSHADLTYLNKYGIKAASGGGRSSARETIGRVLAGALAQFYMLKALNVEIY